MNYIGLQFTDDVFGFGADVYVDQQQHDENGVGGDTHLTQGKEITSHIYFFLEFSARKALPNNRQKRTFRIRRSRAVMGPSSQLNLI